MCCVFYLQFLNYVLCCMCCVRLSYWIKITYLLTYVFFSRNACIFKFQWKSFENGLYHNIWQHYSHEFGLQFFWSTLYFVQLQIDKRLIVIFAQMRASLMFIWAEQILHVWPPTAWLRIVRRRDIFWHRASYFCFAAKPRRHQSRRYLHCCSTFRRQSRSPTLK